MGLKSVQEKLEKSFYAYARQEKKNRVGES